VLRRQPQLQALAIGLAAQAEAAIGHLLLQIRQGQGLFTGAQQHQALFADPQGPVRLVAAGAQQQTIEAWLVAARAFTLYAIDLVQAYLAVQIGLRAALGPAAQVDEQAALAVGAEAVDIAAQLAGLFADQAQAALFAARTQE